MESKAPSLPAQGLHAGRQTGWPASGLKRLGAWVLHHRWVTGAAAALTLLVVFGATWWFGTSSPVEYLTAPVTRGDVVTTITASGSVNPVVIVAGRNLCLGHDRGPQLRLQHPGPQGQLCAKIDPKPYQVVVDQDQADLAMAKAQLAKDRANLVYTEITQKRDDILLE